MRPSSSTPGAVARAAQAPGDALWDPTWVPAAGEATIAARTGSQHAELTLYCSWFCPFAQRAWIACEEKHVPYAYVEVNPYEVDASKPGGYTKRQLALETKRALHPGFVEASPKGLVPAIAVSAEEALCESKPIIEYLDLKFASRDDETTALLPSDPYERAYCRVWADYADERIQRPYYRILIDQSPESRAKAFAEMVEGCRDFARAMRAGGPYFLGNRFTYVDVSFAPFWQRILSVGAHYRGIELPKGADDEDFLRLEQWWTAVSARPSVAKTIVCTDRLVASYWGYAANEATSDYAKGIYGSLSKSTQNASPLNAFSSTAASSSSNNPAALLASCTAVAVAFAIGLLCGRSGFFLGGK